MDEQKRIEEIKAGLKKSVYQEAERIKVEQNEMLESTAKLSNILEGYMDKIDTMDAQNLEELEEELRILKAQNVEVGSETEKDLLVKQYNDYIHNDLDRTIAETIEYTHNLDNHTDDLNEILIRPMDGVEVELMAPVEEQASEPEQQDIANVFDETEVVNTDELFEIEATTDLGVLEDIVELEEDTLDIEGTTVASEIDGSDISQDEVIDLESDEEIDVAPEPKKEKRQKEKKPKKEKPVKEKKEKPAKVTSNDEFDDEKGLTGLDYALIFILISVFAVLIGLVAKINGVF